MIYDEENQRQPDYTNYDIEQQQTQQEEEDDGAESDYSLDYEYLGPRKANYRGEDDADSVASDLSSTCRDDGFDMWDEDPYSTNDFTWESNDMRLTFFIKQRQRQLDAINSIAPWQQNSFWKKEKGWPKQLPASSSTTNHDQSANALSLVLSDLGSSEKLHAVYRDRIIECGNYEKEILLNTIKQEKINTTTYLDNVDNDTVQQAANASDKFIATHASISHSSIHSNTTHSKYQPNTVNTSSTTNDKFISKFIPYTKYIRRSHFPIILPQNSYLSLGFEPMCLAEKYGYMAIGGIEGEFELYCCMDSAKPIKIWGTKFKGKNNVLLMTNAVQVVRWKKQDHDYNYYLIACMNDAGILIYDLPSHRQCQTTANTCHLQCHIRAFDRVPINDARVSPDGNHLVCVGDEACIFHISISFNKQGKIAFGHPHKLKIPLSILSINHQHPLSKSFGKPRATSSSPSTSTATSSTFSSQYVAWSKSSIYFAQTSDTQNNVFVWRTKPHFEILFSIDAGGYTYAIQFHPELEGVLAFSNRYGYLHTVNLDECVSRLDSHRTIRLLDYDRQTTHSNGHTCTDKCLQGDEAVHHTLHLLARHEITMVSFRGEKNKRLRILAKINGLQWSRDGRYLYVSTKKRVLAYEFVQSSCHVQSLEKMASLAALSILERNTKRKRRDQKQGFEEETEDEEEEASKRKRRIWCEKWCKIPAHVRHNVLGDTHLASHW
ncbi:aspartate--tRNA ligase msd1 [Mucor velutinosus]|uniref:Aspartate--tRNA ligase msd1 n=1 Tax=Mucor velutinosus TaxID=708070 RepID=A0AAN7I2I0_9FUNG|nr:aspartate--tRNA ligase msd1 [Mucor velutinosus]